MDILDRLQQKPERERKKLFWLAVAGAGLLVLGVWALSFHATLKTLSYRPLKEAVAPEENQEERSLLSAALGQRLKALKRLLPFVEKTVPGREEVVK